MRPTWAFALCLVLPACASAADYGTGPVDPYSRAGAYVAGAANYSVELFREEFPFSDASDSKVGAGLRIGYRGDNGASLELIADDNRGFRVDSERFEASRLELQSLGLGGRIYLGSGRFQPYGLVGAGWTQAIFSEKNLNIPFSSVSVRNPYVGRDDALFLRGGFGVEMYFSKTFAGFLEASFNRLSKPLGDFHHVDGVAGVMVRF